MRIAYLGQMADVATENGISKKIRAQAECWLRAGHTVRYFALAPTAAVWSGFAPFEAEVMPRGGWLRRSFRSARLAARIAAWRPDAIYFRYAYHSAGLPELFRAVPTVAEINSDDLAEYPLTFPVWKFAYHRATRRRVLGAVAGFVPVTHELATRFAAFGRPARVIANGVELAACAPVPPPAAGAPLRLLFVGSAGTPWHGLDRVTELAALFPEIGFDLVGTERVAAPGNVRFHGVLPRAGYEPLLQGATAALGTFGLYRKKMDEACPLKVREYLAAGLPVLAAYRDTDLPDAADHFLRLPNDAAPLAPHRDRIASWLERWRGRRVPHAALAVIDSGAKERARLAFVAQVAGKGGR